MTSNVTPIRPSEVLTEVGGPVDEFRVSLAIYGQDLDPDLVSSEIGAQPTSAHRKGDRRTMRSPPLPHGAWIRTLEGRAPASPSDYVLQLLSPLPTNHAFWKSLTYRFTVQIRFGIHTSGWNQGFHLSPDAIALIAVTGASLDFDLYFYGNESDA